MTPRLTVKALVQHKERARPKPNGPFY